jgi:hypothetical protein
MPLTNVNKKQRLLAIRGANMQGHTYKIYLLRNKLLLLSLWLPVDKLLVKDLNVGQIFWALVCKHEARRGVPGSCRCSASSVAASIARCSKCTATLDFNVLLLLLLLLLLL